MDLVDGDPRKCDRKFLCSILELLQKSKHRVNTLCAIVGESMLFLENLAEPLQILVQIWY